MKDIKKYTAGFILGASIVGGLTYASGSGLIGDLFEFTTKFVNTQSKEGMYLKDVAIPDNFITPRHISAGTVTEGKIANNAVTTAKIKNGAITDGKIATDAVTTAKIKNLAVTEGKIATDAVTTAKIKNLAVTNAKIASGISADKITIGTLPRINGTTPTANNHLATKGYVDTAVASVGGGIIQYIDSITLSSESKSSCYLKTRNRTGIGCEHFPNIHKPNLPACLSGWTKILIKDVSPAVRGTPYSGGSNGRVDRTFYGGTRKVLCYKRI